MATVEAQREVRAQAKWVRSSARKARLVTDLIRGRSVPEARTILAFSTRDVARDVEKVLRSAVANAEANHGLHGDELVVATAFADEGPTLKRFRPRARGRVGPIKKRTCHITITLSAVDGATLPAPRSAPAAPPPATEPEPVAATAPEATAEQPKPKRTPRAKQTDDAETDDKPKRTPRKKKES